MEGRKMNITAGERRDYKYSKDIHRQRPGGTLQDSAGPSAAPSADRTSGHRQDSHCPPGSRGMRGGAGGLYYYPSHPPERRRPAGNPGKGLSGPPGSGDGNIPCRRSSLPSMNAWKISRFRRGFCFIDEINCVSETLAPTMLQFLQNKTFGTHRVSERMDHCGRGKPAGVQQVCQNL